MPDPIVVANPAVVANSAAVGASVDTPNREVPSSGNRADTSRGDTGATGSKDEKVFTYKEDRTEWLPKYRVDEIQKRAVDRAIKEREEKFQAELDARDRKIKLLAGVEDTDPQTAEDEKVKAELFRMLPGLQRLADGKTLDQIEALLENAAGIESATLHHWEKHALDMATKVEKKIEEAIGGDLTPSQIRTLRRLYRDAAEETLLQREQDPTHDPRSDFLARHDRGDETLVAEFAEAFIKDWFEPVRRQSTVAAANRNRPVPRGERGRPMTSQPVKVDLSKKGAFEDALVQARREEGRAFTE